MALIRKGLSDTVHVSEAVGKHSELIARTALLANGFTVAKPETDESFDIVARDPVSQAWITVQCKTIRQRTDRGGDLVIYAKKGNGEPYALSDADYIIGVLGAEGEKPRVYMFENRGLGEYWATEARASQRWVELPIEMNREAYVC
jgi:hypothetical protein